MSAADELAKLHALFVSGALTQAEFEQAKARVLAGERRGPALDRFRLSDTEKWVAGVCGGIERATGVDAWVWRLIFTLGTIFTGGVLALVYIALWIFVPRASE